MNVGLIGHGNCLQDNDASQLFLLRCSTRFWNLWWPVVFLSNRANVKLENPHVVRGNHNFYFSSEYFRFQVIVLHLTEMTTLDDEHVTTNTAMVRTMLHI